MSGKLKETRKKNTTLTKILIGVLVLIIAGGAYFFYTKYSSQHNSQLEKSIAILPFKNISVNKEENEPFCIGVALELQKK